MCNFCRGSHVIRDVDGPLAFFVTCPICGPKKAEVLEAERQVHLERLAAARKRFRELKENGCSKKTG